MRVAGGCSFAEFRKVRTIQTGTERERKSERVRETARWSERGKERKREMDRWMDRCREREHLAGGFREEGGGWLCDFIRDTNPKKIRSQLPRKIVNLFGNPNKNSFSGAV